MYLKYLKYVVSLENKMLAVQATYIGYSITN